MKERARLASLKPRGRAQEGKQGFATLSCALRRPERANPHVLCRLFMPSRDRTRLLLEHLIAVFGVEAVAVALGVPCWLLGGWRDGSGMLFGQQKRHIWLIHSLFFRPWALRSLLDIITSGRFVPDPATGEIWGLKAEWKRKARRTDAYQAAARRIRKKKRKKRK